MKISKQMEKFCQLMSDRKDNGKPYGINAQDCYEIAYSTENMGFETVFHKVAMIGMHYGVNARLIELGVISESERLQKPEG